MSKKMQSYDHIKTLEDLNELALIEAGQLGIVGKKECLRLAAIGKDHWTIMWAPSNIDPEMGRGKLRPATDESAALLDRGRALTIQKRHPDESLKDLIIMVGVVKKTRHGHYRDIQDFILLYRKDETLVQAIADKDFESFKAHASALIEANPLPDSKATYLRVEELESAFRLMGSVNRALSKQNRTAAPKTFGAEVALNPDEYPTEEDAVEDTADATVEEASGDQPTAVEVEEPKEVSRGVEPYTAKTTVDSEKSETVE